MDVGALDDEVRPGQVVQEALFDMDVLEHGREGCDLGFELCDSLGEAVGLREWTDRQESGDHREKEDSEHGGSKRKAHAGSFPYRSLPRRQL